MTTTTDPTLAGLLDAARGVAPEVTAIRRRIHRRPEIGMDLPVTQDVIVEELGKIGLEGRRGVSLSSVTATIEGGRPGPTVVLRADMDALPLREDTGLDFASGTDGAMHACGHDAHMAMLLGGARLLQERRADLPGRAILMFQPGEEGWHGARVMLEEGLLGSAGADARPPTGAFAIHISNRYPSGEVYLKPGPIMASTDVIRIWVRGRGGHASTPHLAHDPIPVAAEIILALQAMVGRRVNVFDPAVVTIGQVSGGTTSNIIPEEVFLHGTIRTVSEGTRATVRDGVRRVAEGVAAAHGVTVEVDLEPGYPVTVNDAGFTEFARSVAGKLIGAERVVDLEAPVMGGEDWSYLLQQVPGAMVFLGACPPDLDPATAPQFHSNRVVFDEAILPIGVALHAAIATRFLSADDPS